MYLHHFENVKQYVQQNQHATNTQLFSFLALMNAYISHSYLYMSECKKILGPPDPIHGGPPFEKRMEPFTVFINTDGSNREHIAMIHPVLAQTAVELLADLRITRSATVKKLISSLCVDQPQPHIIQFIKDLLTKREMGENGKEKFSRLIEDIMTLENLYNTVSVLETASDTFSSKSIFPQTLSRLYYTREDIIDYSKAEEWARTAITKAPKNSYVADTLGQIYKNRLMREPRPLENIFNRARDAFKAFKDVEEKAEKEQGPGKPQDTASVVGISNSFNNRGLFGFIQVAKLAFEKLNHSQKHRSFIQNLQTEVEAKFTFFERYLTYSKPDKTKLEPDYFWKDVVLCYKQYTENSAAESTSFPGLLDRLNRGRFTSKGRRAKFVEYEVTVSDLEEIKNDLKSTYEANVDDVKVAERYILSNVILSNKMHNSPQLTPVKELQTILHRFLGTEVGPRSPEFYLLVLLLFWPEEQPQLVQEEDDEEMEEQASEDDGTEEDTRAETAQPSLEVMFDLDLQPYTTFMESAFGTAGYAKYLRGRYLLPLFFLGKGTGLRKWIHKSRLDAIVEKEVDAELANRQRGRRKWREKRRQITAMWVNGKVWHVPEIQDILLPVEVSYSKEHEKQKVSVHVGGKKIMATEEIVSEASVLGPMLFYLGFTIQGPVVFKVGFPHSSDE
ncbi:sterile alpha motif domain-containing protein 9-like [Larimichthys crocea]|uniref:sterile alpha motif domain-containing protein 9-like n=1 Tax=Larimichthys crocea TaxID=215358 RepID=UPI000F5FE1B3|nr:sterile alpha motif domain-containing protein 9-like [Larimichthys crocea]